MEEMERQRQELDRMMEESNLQPETEYQYTKIQQPLEQLNEGLRGAGLERILRLSGITSTDFLATGSGKPPGRRVTFNEHGPTKSLQPSSSGNNYKAYRRPAFKWNKLRACMTFPQSKSELNRQPSSTVGTEHRRSRRPAPRLLKEEEEEDKTADEGSHSSSCSSTTTITSPYHPSLKRLLSPDPHQGSSIPAGDPERDHELEILAGSPLVSLFFGHQDAGDRPARNQLTILQLIDLWDSLQNKLFKLVHNHHHDIHPNHPHISSSSSSSSILYSGLSPDPIRVATFELKFVQILFRLASYLLQFRLVNPKFVQNIRIFRPSNLAQIAAFYVDLLFRISTPNHPTTYKALAGNRGPTRTMQAMVVPDFHFFLHDHSVLHFHRSINALSMEDQKQLVYRILQKVFRNLSQQPIPRQGSVLKPNRQMTSSARFQKILEAFQARDFLQDCEHFSPSSSHNDHHHDVDWGRIADARRPFLVLVQDSIAFFQNPVSHLDSEVHDPIRLEFQVVFYLLHFLDSYYHPLLNAILVQRSPSSSSSTILFQNQLGFVSRYLRFYRNYPLNNREHEREKELNLQHDPAAFFFGLATLPAFRSWANSLFKVLQMPSCFDSLLPLHHQRLPDHVHLDTLKLDAWMNKISVCPSASPGTPAVAALGCFALVTECPV
ncbi:hypothetical protein PGTUg99_009888 [Puccinia graminis f. sp. tritici]|uniref:Uncharacterized protein n=1 Tax=Puccinia graminis f. sp. tritici TaxID=56615 RepID=A0A5B0SID3_PUCGR|nr:hypothetical protein PGTUg99_009888 [Puccinia graminis f. sp. tritici]